jgi:hypothetical protein
MAERVATRASMASVASSSTSRLIWAMVPSTRKTTAPASALAALAAHRITSGGYAWIYPTRWDAGGSGGYGSGGGGGAANAFEPDNGYANWGGRGGNGYVMLEFYDPYSVVTNGRYSNLIVWLDSRLGTVPTAAR